MKKGDMEEMDEKWCPDCGTKMELVGSIPAQLFVFQCPKCHKEILPDDEGQEEE